MSERGFKQWLGQIRKQTEFGQNLLQSIRRRKLSSRQVYVRLFLVLALIPTILIGYQNCGPADQFKSLSLNEIKAINLTSTAGEKPNSASVSTEEASGTSSAVNDPTDKLSGDESFSELEGTDFRKTIAVGKQHTCGITSKGQLKCWGQNILESKNFYGWLRWSGQGVKIENVPRYKNIEFLKIPEGSIQLFPTPIESGTKFVSISSSGTETCGLTSYGEISCLSDWQGKEKNLVRWYQNKKYISVAVGAVGVCGITSDKNLECDSYTLDKGVKYSMVAVGGSQTYAITENGLLNSWSGNGVLISGGQVLIGLPIPPDGEVKYKSVSAGFNYVCGITVEGVLKCGGHGPYNMLSKYTGNTLGPVDAGVKYKSVSVGFLRTCAITEDDDLKCWGFKNILTQLRSQYRNKIEPVPEDMTVVDPGVKYKTVDVGPSHTCGMTSMGVTKCWGSNSLGKLGNGQESNYILDFRNTDSNSTSGGYLYFYTKTEEVPNLLISNDSETPIPVQLED